MTMTRTNWLHLGLVSVFIVTFGTYLFLQGGYLLISIIGGAMVTGCIGWVLTTIRKPADPMKILPVYLLTITLLFIHIVEEYSFQFAERIAATFGSTWTSHEFSLSLGTLGPALWFMAAVAFYFRHPIGNFFIWFIFMGMMFGEPTHLLLFPLAEDGTFHYFPGMWTALFPMVPAAYGMYLIVKGYREDTDEGKEKAV